MKVSIYPIAGGTVDVLVQATPGKGLSPVVLLGLTRENLKTEVGKIVADMRRPKVPAQPKPL